MPPICSPTSSRLSADHRSTTKAPFGAPSSSAAPYDHVVTDNAHSESALWEAALEVLRENGPLGVDELADHLEDSGAGSADTLIADLEDRPLHPLLITLPDDRLAAVDALFESRVFTHRLSADDIARDVIEADDIDPLMMLVSEDDDFDLLRTDLDGERLAERGVDADTLEAIEVLMFAPGTLAGYTPGDLLGFRVSGGRVSFGPVAGELRPVPALVGVLESSLEREEVTGLEQAVLQVLADVPVAFTEPAPTLSEIVSEAGLDRRGDLVARNGFDFEGHLNRTMFDLYADRLGIPVEAVPGVALFGSLVDAIDRGDDEDLEARFAAGKSGLFAVLADPDIAEIVYDELAAERIAPASIERAATWILDYAPRRAAGAAHWLAGRAAEAAGRLGDAERHYERSSDLDGAFDLPLFDLARFASDRGDVVRGLSLLARVPGGDEHPLFALLEEYRPREVPGLGRNDRCWCGSGRKYKACHLGRAEHSLEDRVDWLYMKAAMHALEPVWEDAKLTLAEARAGYLDDDAVDEALEDPLVEDILLFDAGAFADFVARRGDLLPADELDLARQWTAVPRSVFEVESCRVGEGMTLRDSRDGERYEVSTPWLGGDIPEGTLLCGRVLPAGPGRWVMPGAAEPVTAEQSARILELLSTEDVDAGELLDLLGAPDAAEFYPSE